MFAHIHDPKTELIITQSQDQIYQGLKTLSQRYIYRMENTPLYDRIVARLNELGLSERQASLQAVGNSQFIRNIRKGTSTSPRADNIVKLAKVLKVKPSWLMGSDDEDLDQSESTKGVRYGGIVEAGTFRKVDSMDQDSEYRIIPVAPDPRYPAASQFAFEVVGDSMNMAHIEAGMWLLAVQLNSYEKFAGDVPDQALVIAAIHRNGDPDREITVKRYRIFKDRIELRAESTNKTHEDRVYPHDQQSDTGILAVVLWAGWRLL